MKKTLFFICAASCAAMVSCNKIDSNSAPADGTISLVALSTIDQDTKAFLGDPADNKYPIYWNDVEKAALDEFIGTTKSQEIQASSFIKTDASNGSFSFTLDEKEGEIFDYYVVTPGKNPGETTNPTHGWRACKTGNISYIINHTVDQVPLADRPDPTTHVMVAKDLGHSGQATSLNLSFSPVVSYGKMTITGFPALAAGETVTKITITTPAGKYMSGRYYEDIQTGERTPYNANNIKNYVTIDPRNISFNTTAFDVWFTTYSLDLVAGDILSVSVQTSVKTYDANLTLSKALSFKTGKVSSFTYNWTKGQPEVETKTLTFDFSTCPAGWPSGESAYKSTEPGEKEFTYTLNDVDYVFSTGVVTDVATTRSVCWGYNGTAACEMLIIQNERFLGLPAISGWKLTTIEFCQALSTNASRNMAITDIISEKGKQVGIAGGEKKYVGTKDEKYTFILTSAAANTRYYMAPMSKGTGLTSLTLTYEKVD